MLTFLHFFFFFFFLDIIRLNWSNSFVWRWIAWNKKIIVGKDLYHMNSNYHWNESVFEVRHFFMNHLFPKSSIVNCVVIHLNEYLLDINEFILGNLLFHVSYLLLFCHLHIIFFPSEERLFNGSITEKSNFTFRILHHRTMYIAYK